jgi:5'(3')-deoxyribonucleotidase
LNTVAIDVDLTVVDTLNPWLFWFYNKCGARVLNENGSYDLVPEMKELQKLTGHEHFHPFDFWHKKDLYDKLNPLDGAVEAVKRLKNNGYNVIFVSQSVPEHTNSKISFLNKHFPSADGFISTHDKHFVDYSVLIDDKLEHLYMGKKYKPNSQHIQFCGVRSDTNYINEGRFSTVHNWHEICPIDKRIV